MVAFMKRTLAVIFPSGGRAPAPWFMALGTAKRNAINDLQKEAHNLLNQLPEVGRDLANASSPESRFQKFPDPQAQADKWRDYYVFQLEKWGKNLRTLEIASQGGDEDRAIKRDGFTIVPMPGLKKAEIEVALQALDEAAGKIRSKFPQVLYGNVFFSTHLTTKTAAHYVNSDDSIHLSVRIQKRYSDVYTLIHELGHRYDHKFLKSSVRDEFWALSTRKVYETIVYDDKLRQNAADEVVSMVNAKKNGTPSLGLSPTTERWLKYIDVKPLVTGYLAGKIDEKKFHADIKGHEDRTAITDKLIHGPLSVTPYGATKPTENFAEAFAHFVLGLDMPPQLAEIMGKL